MPTPTKKRRRPGKSHGPEAVIRAIQGAAVAALGAYRVIKPAVAKWKKKRAAKKRIAK